MDVDAFRTIQNPGTFGNIPLELFRNRWQKPGDNAKYARFTTTYNQPNARTVSNLGYTDASNIRLNNISFSWALAEKLYRKLGLKGGRIGINAQNIFVITKYTRASIPIFPNFNSMPPVRTIVASISLTL